MIRWISKLIALLSRKREEMTGMRRKPTRDPDYIERNIYGRSFWWDEMVFSFHGADLCHPLCLVDDKLKWDRDSRYFFPRDVHADYMRWLDRKFEKEVLG